MKKKKSKTIKRRLNDGKFFEMIVECLQRLFSPEGFKITPSKKFYDDDGTQVGEVDVVIEGEFNSQQIMVGVECRDRKNIPGVEWIQQIIGRRITLAEFGFTHWLAVSRKGFAKTAINLAKKHKIPLLIPGKVEPVDKDKPGFHTFMQFSMEYIKWIPDEFKGKLQWDDKIITEAEIDIIESELKTKSPNLNLPGLKPTSIIDFLTPYAQDFSKQNEELFRGLTRVVHTFKFEKLDAEFDGKLFTFIDYEVSMEFRITEIKPEFQIMAFAIPDKEKK